MGRNKQTAKKATGEDAKHRKETKEERRIRLKHQEEAREQCLKALPYAGGGILVFIIIFVIYVSLQPAKQPRKLETTPNILNATVGEDGKINFEIPPSQGGVPGANADASGAVPEGAEAQQQAVPPADFVEPPPIREESQEEERIEL